MELAPQVSNAIYRFVRAELRFGTERYRDVFSRKNNKTLRETLRHPRYGSLAETAQQEYSANLDEPLGIFLLKLKNDHDDFYKQFLNKYGDAEFSNFSIAERQFFDVKGIYAYTSGGTLRYVGRSRDALAKRINLGYGTIHPKNCYRDGQATNCHLNALITLEQRHVEFWVYPMTNDDEIVRLEREILEIYRPLWNIRL